MLTGHGFSNPSVAFIKDGLENPCPVALPSHRGEFLIAVVEEFFERFFFETLDFLDNRGLDGLRRGNGIGVRAAFGFGDDAVNDAEAFQILGGDFQRFRGGGGKFAVAPQNGGATLRRNDGVNGVGKHEDHIAHGNPERAATAAFAGDDNDHRHAEYGHFLEGFRDGLGLSARLGLESGIRAGVSTSVTTGRL